MPGGHKTAAAEGDGFVLVETTADEVAKEAAELSSLRDYIRCRAEITGIEAPGTFSRETLRLADVLGNQFDTLSVAEREDAVVVSADQRLRMIASSICSLSSFGLDGLLDELSRQQAVTENERLEALLTLCDLRHSFVSFSATTLLSIFKLDNTPNLDRFRRIARYIGGPDANFGSHVKVASQFSDMAITEFYNDLRSQAAIGIVLSNLIRLAGPSLASVINSFAHLADNPLVTRYLSGWLHGHFLHSTYVAQVQSVHATTPRERKDTPTE